jgi:hypothetical protein
MRINEGYTFTVHGLYTGRDSSFSKQKEANSKQQMETINDAINLKLDVVTQQKKRKEKNVMKQRTETVLSLAI